jgi:acetyl/propionyl-CoA carboxylase alpha subunit/acetyl-CoA carboxylase carboxyltransferase component
VHVAAERETVHTLLVANRGEIAIRIMRAASEFGVRTIAVYSDDDVSALHTRKADEARALGGTGAAAYLDIERVIAVAQQAGADAIHPGYGFLSENAQFARRCGQVGITFVGPSPDVLALFGDKAAARALAQSMGVAVLQGTPADITVEQAAAFLTSLGQGGAIMLKATAGGGGRGARIVTDVDDLPELFERCRSEATSAFGDGTLFAETFMPQARHIEVQIIGDGAGQVTHLYERECSIQRRHQKLIEMAPAPGISAPLRTALTDDAVRMARQVSYGSLGTFEFLVDVDTDRHVFIEANPRLQVEHTVTEQVLGIDIVRAQLELASGRSLTDLGLDQGSVPAPRGIAIQARVNMETMAADGTARPGGGVLTAFEVPSGAGYRTDSFGYVGYRTSGNFDPLLAKIIVHSPSGSLPEALAKSARALAEFRVEGVATNTTFLQAILHHPDVQAHRATTRFVDDHMADLVEAASAQEQLYFATSTSTSGAGAGAGAARLAGAKVSSSDPLAVLDYASWGSAKPAAEPVQAWVPDDVEGPTGTTAARSSLQGTVVQIDVAVGDVVRVGQQLLVMEAMKMEHVLSAPESGYVRQVVVAVGDIVFEGHALVFVEPADVGDGGVAQAQDDDIDGIRPDLADLIARHEITLDAARPDAVARRRKSKQRTARENIDDLCDPGTFVEHGNLVLTPGTGLPKEEVIRKFPTDGMVCGVGSINSDRFGDDARAVVLSYDYTVLAGTQGAINHPKTDRMLEIAKAWKLPMVFFTEGGGGRAGTGGNRTGDANAQSAVSIARPALVTPTFSSMARLNGVVPTIGINSGRCFAGNAALLGACDVVIATDDSNIGMGGPAMVEGGGLGVFSPDEIGPIDVQLKSGVVDIDVRDEAQAVAAAKHYLSFFQGRIGTWDAADQRILRNIVPTNRLRTYEIRKVIDGLADTGSVLELRRHFGLGMVTALCRVEGRPLGILANDPNHLAGAIDSDGSDKAARFMQLCEAFDIPLLVLCDTPGIMVGPEVEKTGLVRHANRLFVTGANLTIPMFMVVIRKAYGLGALAMAGGNVFEPMFTVAWPSGEFAGMGLEGQIKLGYRAELMAIVDPQARLARFQALVAEAYEQSKAIHQGVMFGVDDVIDPMHTRHWVANGLKSTSKRARSEHPRRVDVW